LQCRNEVTCNPGIICIVCYQALPHSSEHGTSSMGRHLLANRTHCRVKQINRVWSFWSDKYNHWWTHLGHIAETRQSRN
jgi:hypothetical protein